MIVLLRWFRVTRGLRLWHSAYMLIPVPYRYSCADETPHDLVAKRSEDGGRSWGAMQMVVDPGVVWGPSEDGPRGGAV